MKQKKKKKIVKERIFIESQEYLKGTDKDNSTATKLPSF